MGDKYILFKRWGRVGALGQTMKATFDNVNEAISVSRFFSFFSLVPEIQGSVQSQNGE